MAIILKRVEDKQRDLLFRLLQYSLFEESLTDGNEMDEQGWFAYPQFDAYFTESGYEAYLICEDEQKKVCGFAMINTQLRSGRTGHSIMEFMILPGCRRKGIGTAAAHACFSLHRGVWEVAPALGSESARLFWDQAIARYLGTRCEMTNGLFIFRK
ncbi:MAG: GNAT family N-acetyltransferase [Clostridia bacterium]|nr:GNAT family N-acetyltransferase [Clostridia bacterium]